MTGKSIIELPDFRLREAVAVFLYGLDYTGDQLRSIAILDGGRWYRYPDHGTYTKVGKIIKVAKDKPYAES